MICLTVWACGAVLAQPISSFETEDSLKLFGFGGVKAERVQEHASDGEWALKAFFPGNEKDTWPGIAWKPGEDTAKYHAVVFDVYNPSDDAVALSWRIDVEGRDAIFGGRSLPPKKMQQVEIWVRRMGPITNVYPYIRMPRNDYTLYFDNFRWETLDGYFRPIHYVDDAQAPAPTELETAQGFILFQRALTDVVFANSVPRLEERATALQVFATPGEYEPATISLYALKDLAQVRVSFEGIPAGGEVLPVRCRDKRVTYPSKEYIVGMPVLCERREAVDVPQGASQRFLIDLHVDTKTKAGTYEGTVSIACAGGEPTSVPLRLRVLPFNLAESADMLLGEYYTSPKLAKTQEEKEVSLRRDMIDMRQHGRTSVGLCFGPPTANVAFTEDGVCQLNFDGSSLYEKFMDLYVEFEYPAPVILLADSGQGAAGKDVDLVFESEEWGERYKAFWAAMQEEHKARGWPEVIVQPVDEPGWQSRERKDRNVRCLKLLKQIPGMRTEQDGPGDDYFHNEAGPWADFWNYNGSLSKPEVVQKAIADGKTILIYNCDVESYRPEVDRYTAGWFQVVSGGSGCFNWAYISYSADPYDDQSHRTGTWMHVYPPLGDEPGGPSTGWIAAREGADDFKYIHTLRQAIERAEKGGSNRAKQAAKRAQDQLEALVSSLEYSPGVRSQARWTQTAAQPDGAKTIGGTLKLSNGWTHREYEKARWRVAAATLSVLEALGDIPPAVMGAQMSTGNGPLLTAIRWEEKGAGPGGQATWASERQATVPVWSEGPEIDGALDDEIWSKAVRLDPFTLSSGKGAPSQQTDVLVGSDGKHLYIGATCHEDNIAHITANVTKDGGRVWEDDCIEVFVDDNLDRRTFRQIMVNSLGVQGWNNTADNKWRASSMAAAEVGEDLWTVELAIPMADLGLGGGEFGFNVCRERRPMETLELSCWSPTGGGFGAPERFGLANLGQAWIGAMRVPPASIGKNEFSVTLKNETGQGRNVTTVLWMKWQDRGLLRGLDQLIGLAPGQQLEFTYQYELPDEQAPTMTFSVRDLQAQEDGKPAVLAERTFAPTILPPLKMTLRPRTYYLSDNLGRVELQINLAETMRENARLVLTVHDASEVNVLREHQFSPIEGNRLEAQISLRGLPEGSYKLRALLATKEGKRIAERWAPIERLRGPFD